LLKNFDTKIEKKNWRKNWKKVRKIFEKKLEKIGNQLDKKGKKLK